MNNAMLRFPNFKEKAFTLNYDDGLKCDEKLVGIMKKYGCKGTFELPTDWMTLNPTCKQDDPRLFELAEQFANFKHDERRANGWFIKPPKWFIVWGHSTEMERAEHWGRMDELCKMMGTRDDVWNATTGEVYDYVQAFHSLEFSVDSEIVRNKSAFDIYLVVNCAKYVVPAGQTVRVGELSKGRELL